jgi:hypothetical protein
MTADRAQQLAVSVEAAALQKSNSKVFFKLIFR